MDFFFPDEELLLDQGLEKKGFVMRPWFVSAAAGCWLGPEQWLGLMQRWDLICLQPLPPTRAEPEGVVSSEHTSSVFLIL